jgi:hypothetical protein
MVMERVDDESSGSVGKLISSIDPTLGLRHA